jgi:hypothetical protein
MTLNTLATALAALILLLIAPPAQAATNEYRLPAGALMIETQPVGPGRAMILWMSSPKRNPRIGEPDEPYTCPDETRGSHYTGPTRVSLVNTKTRRIINTLKVKEYDSTGDDKFDIPYQIHAGSYYHVEGVPEGQEGTPTILWLKDYNGDGKALEFALFNAEACMGLSTTLIGYSERQDRVIQYPVRLEAVFKGKRSIQAMRWVDYLFSQEPRRPGYWKYEIDYRGRGGLLDAYEIHYNEQAERFEGKRVSTEDE